MRESACTNHARLEAWTMGPHHMILHWTLPAQSIIRPSDDAEHPAALEATFRDFARRQQVQQLDMQSSGKLHRSPPDSCTRENWCQNALNVPSKNRALARGLQAGGMMLTCGAGVDDVEHHTDRHALVQHDVWHGAVRVH